MFDTNIIINNNNFVFASDVRSACMCDEDLTCDDLYYLLLFNYDLSNDRANDDDAEKMCDLIDNVRFAMLQLARALDATKRDNLIAQNKYYRLVHDLSFESINNVDYAHAIDSLLECDN